MEAEGILTALAEVAIAIAGFSGIVVALQHRGDSWSPNDRARIALLLRISIIYVFASFLPILLYLVDPSEAFVWPWSSGIWLVVFVAIASYDVRRYVPVQKADPEPVSSGLMIYMGVNAAVGIGLQVANILWLRSAWPHVMTILLGLLLACLMFVRLLRHVVRID